MAESLVVLALVQHAVWRCAVPYWEGTLGLLAELSGVSERTTPGTVKNLTEVRGLATVTIPFRQGPQSVGRIEVPELFGLFVVTPESSRTSDLADTAIRKQTGSKPEANPQTCRIEHGEDPLVRNKATRQQVAIEPELIRSVESIRRLIEDEANEIDPRWLGELDVVQTTAELVALMGDIDADPAYCKAS